MLAWSGSERMSQMAGTLITGGRGTGEGVGRGVVMEEGTGSSGIGGEGGRQHRGWGEGDL